MATEWNSIETNGGEREECATYLWMEMEIPAQTALDVVPSHDRARELLGFGSVIPKEQKE